MVTEAWWDEQETMRQMLKYTYLDMELEVFVHVVNEGEDVAHDTWDNALQVGVTHDALSTNKRVTYCL